MSIKLEANVFNAAIQSTFDYVCSSLFLEFSTIELGTWMMKRGANYHMYLIPYNHFRPSVQHKCHG